MYTEIDLEDVIDFITNEKFADFLLANTTDFGTAAFILQTLLEKVDELKSQSFDEADDVDNDE